MNIDKILESDFTIEQKLLQAEHTLEQGLINKLCQKIKNGSCEPAIIVYAGTVAVAALHCAHNNSCIHLKFSKKMTSYLKENYKIKIGSHLIAINNYDESNEVNKFHPVIAETIAGKKSELREIHKSLGMVSFEKFKQQFSKEFQSDPQEYRHAYPHLSSTIVNTIQPNTSITQSQINNNDN